MSNLFDAAGEVQMTNKFILKRLLQLGEVQQQQEYV